MKKISKRSSLESYYIFYRFINNGKKCENEKRRRSNINNCYRMIWPYDDEKVPQAGN